MKGSQKDYGFGQKNNWRRWLWNEILKRTSGREKNEFVLYLAGPNDHDRKVAASKGVPVENMVAIDRCAANVASIRRSGGSAICADAINVLRAWPDKKPVCVIALDFCSGLLGEEDTILLMGLIGSHPSLRHAVVAVNFMRGRDGNQHAEYLRKNWANCSSRSRASAEGILSDKHRGMAFAFGYLLHTLSAARRSGTGLEKCRLAADSLIWALRPVPRSYRSGTLVFDSVVMSPVSAVVTIADDSLRALQETHPKDVDTSRKIAATLAVRTQRMRSGVA